MPPVPPCLWPAVRTQGATSCCPSQEEPLPLLAASAYAAGNPAMAANDAFPFANGTVQGARWYTVLGSMQVRVRVRQ